jgi:hypothetical protein
MLAVPFAARGACPVFKDSAAEHLSYRFFSFQTLTTPSRHPEYITLLSWSVSSVLIQSLWADMTAYWGLSPYKV